MADIYDLGSQAGREAFCRRLGLTQDSLAVVMEGKGLLADAVLEENDVRQLQRELKPVDSGAHSVTRMAEETYRGAMSRCRTTLPLVLEARRAIFGGSITPFPGNMDDARGWLEAERGKLGDEDRVREGETGVILAWPGQGDWQAYALVSGQGLLAQLADWCNRLAAEARVMPSQATAYILTGSVILGYWSH